MLKTTELIKTESFELAIYKRGDENSEKLAIVLPGRLDTKDYPHMREHVDFLASKGYLALSFDPPGTWESPGDISIYSTTNYLKAIDEIITFYGSKPTLLMGHSRGGSMAILAGTRLEKVKAFIAVMSRATYKTNKFIDNGWKETGFNISTRDTPEEYEERTKEFRTPYSFVEDSQKYDMIEDLKVCNKPKLFVAGLRDVLILPEKVKESFELSSEPKQFFEIDSKHDYRLDKSKIDEVNGFIEKFLTSSNLI